MSVISYKCPNCDGELIFDPATQKYKCEYCNSLFSQEELDELSPAIFQETMEETEAAQQTETAQQTIPKEYCHAAKDAQATDENSTYSDTMRSNSAEQDGEQSDKNRTYSDTMKSYSAEQDGEQSDKESTYSDTMRSDSAAQNGEQSDEDSHTKSSHAVIYSCPSCGAQIVTDETTAATFCYYCHNPVVLQKRLEGKYLPDEIIPFSIDRKEAETRFLDYVSHKKFVPRYFFQKKQIEMITGVYFPFWLYDTKMDGRLTADATRTRVWVAGDEEFTETKFYEVNRGGKLELKNLAQNALNKANAKLIEGILPYRFDEMQKFHMGFLSGFQAERRDVEMDKIAADMRSEMQEYGQRMLRESVDGYNSVRTRGCTFQEQEEQFRYVLLPVWTVTYRSRQGKVYYFSMNGQTGSVCGELPIDYPKLGLVSAIVTIVVLMLALIGGYFI